MRARVCVCVCVCVALHTWCVCVCILCLSVSQTATGMCMFLISQLRAKPASCGCPDKARGTKIDSNISKLSAASTRNTMAVGAFGNALRLKLI